MNERTNTWIGIALSGVPANDGVGRRVITFRSVNLQCTMFIMGIPMRNVYELPQSACTKGRLRANLQQGLLGLKAKYTNRGNQHAVTHRVRSRFNL